MTLFELCERGKFSSLHVGNALGRRFFPRRGAPPQLMQIHLYLTLLFGGQPGQALLDLKHAHDANNYHDSLIGQVTAFSNDARLTFPCALRGQASSATKRLGLFHCGSVATARTVSGERPLRG